jgi:hypothetical protein
MLVNIICDTEFLAAYAYVTVVTENPLENEK